MQLTNPAWIHHSGGAIYSIDIHPSGSKVATCGQGSEGGSGLVVVWNVEPVINEKKSQDSSCHKMLSRMLHQTCVNCVRWSPDGKLLGCGGDEHTLTVWEFGGRISSAGTIGSKETANVEKYREKFRLYGHTMDVLHLEWSKNGKFLASCGMDNTVIIWDALNLPNKFIVLDKYRDGHSGAVKGLSWDPIGKFLATQSADKTVKIWATDSWRCVKVIDEPFVESSQTTMFCRMDWSPDGTYLIVPCSTNNAGPTAQLVRRKDWDTTLDLVGHRKATTVVRACPRLIHYTNHKGVRLQLACFAVGSRDKTISVWLIPNVDRPLVVLHKLFKHSVMDFSWNDLHLTICSMDGSVKSILFNTDEVGRLLQDNEMGDVCEKLYSRRPSQYTSNHLLNGRPALTKVNENVMLGDDIQALRADREQLKKQMDEEAAKKRTLMQRINGQLESNTVVSKLEEAPKAAVAPAHQNDEVKEHPARPTEQTEVRTKTGKRRIQPVFLASLAPSDSEGPSTNDEGAPTSSDLLPAASASRVSSAVVSHARERSSLSEEANAEKSDVEKMDSDEEPVVKRSRKELPFLSEKPTLRPVPIRNELTVALSEGRSAVLPVPVQKRQLVVTVKTSVLCFIDKVEVLNEFQVTSVTVLTKLTGTAKGAERWSCFVDPVACILIADSSWTVIGCLDRSIFVFSTSSGRRHIRITVDSVPSSLHVSGPFLSACTSHGFIYVWNLETQKSVLSRRPIGDVCENGSKLAKHLLSSAGVPVISLTSGKSYAFSLEMDCWQLVGDEHSPLLRIGNSFPTLKNQCSTGASLDELAPVRENVSYSVPADVRLSATHAMLEERLSSAKALASAEEYRHYLIIYVQSLINNGLFSKLKEVFSLLFETNILDDLRLRSDVVFRELFPLLKGVPECKEMAQEALLRIGSNFVQECDFN